MKILEREISAITYAANQTRTIQLPRNYAYRCINLLLIADMYREAGATLGTGKDSAPAQLVKNIMIRANGRDVIKNIDMESLHRINQLAHGTRPVIDAPMWGGGAAIVVGNKVVQVVSARIDFEMWRSVRPIDTLLDSAGLATLEMIITWGTGNDTMTPDYDPAGAGVTVADAQLFVSSVEEVGVPEGTQFMMNKEYMIRSQVTATSNRHQIQLPVGNLYRWLILKCHSVGLNVCSILPFTLALQNTITLQAGTEVFKYRMAGALNADNRLDYMIEVPELLASAAALNHRLLENGLEGYYVLEFCKDGRLTECLDTSRLSSLELILDVVLPAGSTDAFIDIYPCELIRPPVIAA